MTMLSEIVDYLGMDAISRLETEATSADERERTEVYASIEALRRMAAADDHEGPDYAQLTPEEALRYLREDRIELVERALDAYELARRGADADALVTAADLAYRVRASFTRDALAAIALLDTRFYEDDDAAFDRAIARLRRFKAAEASLTGSKTIRA